MYVAILTAVLLLSSLAGAQSACLSYSGKTTLLGKISVKVFPGPPNYESVSKGDSAEHDLFVTLSRPACVDADADDVGGVNVAVAEASEFQLTANSHLYKEIDRMVGHVAVISGTLFGAATGHHHTPVLMFVESADLRE